MKAILSIYSLINKISKKLIISVNHLEILFLHTYLYFIRPYINPGSAFKSIPARSPCW